MSFPDPIIIGANNFNRIKDGSYLYDGSSIDQPARLLIKNSDLKENGTSSFVVERSYQVNQVDKPDATLRVYTVVRGDLSVFDKTQIQSFISEINTFCADSSNMDRILRGEN